MDLSIVVARILALTYLCAAIAALSGKISFGKIMEDMEKSQGLTFISGFVTLVLGMLLVSYHNIWAKNWTVLITLIGWAALLKGVRLIAFPQTNAYLKSWIKNTQAWGLLMLAFGLLFGYFGFL